MKKIIKQLSLISFLSFILCLPYFVFAAGGPLEKLKTVGSGQTGPYAGADENSLAMIIGVIVNAALSLLGVIFIVLIVWAGYSWMTAGGNEEEVTNAKNKMKTAIIGLVITISTFIIWRFISSYLL